MRSITRAFVASCALVSLCEAGPAQADWLPTGNPLCRMPEDMFQPVGQSQSFCFLHCFAGLGVYWQDQRFGYGSIFRSSVSDVGAPPYSPGDIPAELVLQIAGTVMPVAAVSVPRIQCLSQSCSAATILIYQASPGGGGALLRAQRLDDLTDFGPDGVAVADAAGGQMLASAVPDDSGGVVIAWLELNSSHRWVYAQRIDAHGNRRWGSAGVLVGSDTTTQSAPLLAADSGGGAYVLRNDRRGASRALALFHLLSNGSLAPAWPASGVLLGTQPAEVAGLQLRVGPSGVWAVWSQIVTLPNSGLVRRPYVTHLLADGTPAAGFTLAGAPVASGLEGEAVVTDSGLGASGDLMTLIEYTQQWPAPSASGTDLLAQRVLTGGGQPTGWPANGRVVCDAPGVQKEGHMFRQGDGAFFAWKDQRADDGDIYALRVLADGTLPTEWSVNGLLVCGVAGMQYLPVIGYNTVGGGFVAWLDQRDHATHLNDLYGQTVSGDARLSTEPDVPVSFALSAARPNPARGPVRVRLDLPVDASVAVEVLDVAGRLVHRESFEAVAGSREFSWDLRTTGGVHARPGLYLMRVRAAGFQRSTRVVVTE